MWSVWCEQAEDYFVERSGDGLRRGAQRYRGRGRERDPQPRRAAAPQRANHGGDAGATGAAAVAQVRLLRILHALKNFGVDAEVAQRVQDAVRKPPVAAAAAAHRVPLRPLVDLRAEELQRQPPGGHPRYVPRPAEAPVVDELAEGARAELLADPRVRHAALPLRPRVETDERAEAAVVEVLQPPHLSGGEAPHLRAVQEAGEDEGLEEPILPPRGDGAAGEKAGPEAAPRRAGGAEARGHLRCPPAVRLHHAAELAEAVDALDARPRPRLLLPPLVRGEQPAAGVVV
eukprot:gene5516-biopygen4072